MSYRNRSMLGVTLLEIMLVLAIAGMIIVMSVRYYQAASISSQTNSIIQQIVGIVAAEESSAQGGAYVTNAVLVSSGLLPDNAFTTPWGTTITVAVGASGGFVITIPNTPPTICTSLTNRFKGNNRMSLDAACKTLTYT